MHVVFFLVKTFGYLYVWVLLLRVILQWVRADYRNPISQFVVRTTSPLVIPLRRVIPSWGGIDLATLVAAVIVQFLLCVALILLATDSLPSILQLLYLTLLRLVHGTLRLYMFVIIIWVIMSWINPGHYNPLSALFSRMSEPLLRPVRRRIPPIGGFDLSPLFVIIALQALALLIPVPRGYSFLFWGGTFV